MEFVTIAGTDLKASRIGLGTWAMSGWMWVGTDEEESVRTIRAALDKGINLNRHRSGLRLRPVADPIGPEFMAPPARPEGARHAAPPKVLPTTNRFTRREWTREVHHDSPFEAETQISAVCI